MSYNSAYHVPVRPHGGRTKGPLAKQTFRSCNHWCEVVLAIRLDVRPPSQDCFRTCASDGEGDRLTGRWSRGKSATKMTRESWFDRVIEPDIGVVEGCPRLLRQAVEGLDECNFGSVEQPMCEGGVQLMRQSLEILLACVEERFQPEDCRCPSCGAGRLNPEGSRRKLLDTTLGLMTIWRGATSATTQRVTPSRSIHAIAS